MGLGLGLGVVGLVGGGVGVGVVVGLVGVGVVVGVGVEGVMVGVGVGVEGRRSVVDVACECVCFLLLLSFFQFAQCH